MERIVIGITGASGAILAKKLIDALTAFRVELIISSAGAVMLKHELGISPKELAAADHVHLHNIGDIGATIASGSYKSRGMAIIPCSMATVAAVACGLSDNLIRRAADVCLKERRTLLLAVRETPLSSIHLENMHKLAQAGAFILPPVPAWYNKPTTLDEMENAIVGKILDCFGIPHGLSPAWAGT